MLVYNIWIQYTNLFKSYGPETIFQSRKRAITPKIIDGFYSKSCLTYILWLYTCVQNFNPTYQLFQKISHGNPFSKLKRAITPKIIGGFYPKSNDLHFVIIHLCIKFQSNTPILSKEYRTETKSVTYGTDVRTAVILYAPQLKMAGA